MTAVFATAGTCGVAGGGTSAPHDLQKLLPSWTSLPHRLQYMRAPSCNGLDDVARRRRPAPALYVAHGSTTCSITAHLGAHTRSGLVAGALRRVYPER